MAAKTVEKLNRELDCAVCMTTLKNPKSLSCMHSFCEDCLKQCDKASEISAGELKCPMCRKVTTLPGDGVEGLKSNPLICRVIEVLEAKKSSSHIMCDACGDSESPLTTYCRDCLHFICDSCAISHAKMKLLMKNHCTVPLDKIDNGSIKIKWTEEGLWRKAYECEEHRGEPRRFYCRTCKRRICRDCIVLDHTKPDHECTTVQKMYQEAKEEVKDLSKSCVKQEEKVCCMLQDIDVSETEANRKFQAMKHSIRDFKATAEARLKKEEEELLQQVQKFEGKFNHKIQAFRDKIEETKGNLTRVQSRAKDVISTKEDSDITKAPFFPEDVVNELKELIETDITMAISTDVVALKGTMVREGQKFSKQDGPFAKLSLPRIWRETQLFLNTDKDIVKIFCDGTSVYVACKKGIYKKRMSCDVDPSPWLKLRHDSVNDEQVIDMAISMKDKTFCFIAHSKSTGTQISRCRLDDFETPSGGFAMPSSSIGLSAVTPCLLDSFAKITVDSKSRIVVADNSKLKVVQEVLKPAVSEIKCQPPASSASKAGKTKAAITPATAVPVGFMSGFSFGGVTTPQVKKQQGFGSLSTALQQQPQQQSIFGATQSSAANSFGATHQPQFNFGSTPQQPSFGATLSQQFNFGSTPQQPSFGATPQRPSCFPFGALPQKLGATPQQPASFGVSPQQPASFGVSPQQPASFGVSPQQPSFETTPFGTSSPSISAPALNLPPPPGMALLSSSESKAHEVKTQCTPFISSSIFTTSTTIYRGKPEKVSTPASSRSSGGLFGCTIPAAANESHSKPSSTDSFQVPFDRVRSLASAKSGQLVFLRGDKKAVIIADKDGTVQHEIKEPGKMYLSISCMESDALFVLSAFWGSHNVTLTKYSLEDGTLLEYVIDELDVSDGFQSDEWPVIGNYGNDLVIMNTGNEIRVFSAEDWDILDDDLSEDCTEEDKDDVTKDDNSSDK